MANVAHSTLTGADLHEPKGIAAAAADKVYVSNGAGSGVWQKLTNNQLDKTANPLGAHLFHVSYLTTVDYTPTKLAWTKVSFNTTHTNEISGASIASGVITLPAGTYWIEGFVIVNECKTGAQARFRNTSDNVTAIVGSMDHSLQVDPYDRSPMSSFFKQRLTIAGSKTFELQLYLANSAYGQFEAGLYGEANRNADLQIFKIA